MALMVAIAVMAIFMGVAVQTASFAMRREKEEELIFRGEQYVEAIRLFRQKYGRYPMSLKEIWEAKPRVIRKKWKDPITDSYNWGLIFQGQQGGNLGRVRPPGALVGTPPASPTPGPTPGPEGSGGPPSGTRARGPIVGVYSLSCDQSIKVYKGRTRYCEWKFVFEERPQGGAPGGARPPGGAPPGGRPPGRGLGRFTPRPPRPG